MRVLDLFSGAGGLALGFSRAGMEHVAFCEQDEWCRRVLAEHFPGVPCYLDVKTIVEEMVDNAANPCKNSRKFLKESGMGRKRDPKYEEAARLYQQGFTIRDVAEYFNVTHQAMWMILKRRVKLRPQKRTGDDNHFSRQRGIDGSVQKRASHLVEKAIKKGILVPGPCENCGVSATLPDGRRSNIGHHADYNSPLSVEWLCRRCHYDWHKHNIAIGITGEIAGEPAAAAVDVVCGGFP